MAEGAVRTEPATPRRREDARRQGRVVVSPELAPAAILLAAVVLASAGGPAVVRHAAAGLRDWLAAVGPAAIDDVAPAALVGPWAGALAWLAAGIALAAGGAVVAQVGWHPSPALALPDPRRIALATGWARLASRDGAAVLAKAAVTIALAGTVGWHVVGRVAARALDAPALPVGDVLALAAGGLRELALGLAAALALVGAADHVWARRREERRLRMSRRELRDEDGDPELRRRVRRAHRDAAARRGPADVAGADVILTSPGHVAVALRYRVDEGDAARVLAAGAGARARRIEHDARAAGVPLVERRALARALVRAVPGGCEVPPALYRAVAEVFAYLHARGGREGSA